MPLISERPQQGLPTPATQPRDAAPGPRPDAGDTLGAAFRQFNVVGSIYDRVATGEKTFKPDESYDPLEDVSGYESYARRFLESESPEETQQIRNRIDRERRDQQTISDAGGFGLAASFAAGALDPATLISLAIPVSNVGTIPARVGKLVATSIAIDSVSEVAMQNLQETRTAEQSLINVGAGAVLSGLLGGVIASRVPRADFDRSVTALNGELNSFGSTVGAASARQAATLEEEGIAGVGEALAKTIGRISPLSRLLTSDSKAARQIAQDLGEVPFALTKNEMGIASATAVETLVKRYDATVAKFAVAFDESFQSYRARARTAGGAPIKALQFREEIAKAMRRGDESAIPEVAALAKQARSTIIDPLTKQLQSVGLLKDPVAEDVARLTAKAVGKYFKAEAKQLFADFKARTLVDARSVIGTELRAAVAKERQATKQTLAPARAARRQAEDAYRLRRAEIQEQFEQPAGWQATREEMRAKRTANRKARTELEKARNAERAARALEMKRLDAAKGKLRRKASRELKSAAPSRKSFFKRVRKGDESDPALKRLGELQRKRDSGQLAKVVKVPESRVTGFKQTIGTESYLPRLYNVPKIKANRAAWDQALFNWFRREGVDEAEIPSLINDITRTVTGSMRGYTSLTPGVVVKSGRFKERTLNVPDQVLEPFLINDAERVLTQYIRSVAPQLEITRRFGDLELKQAVQNLKDEYDQLLARATTDKERKAIADRADSDLKDIEGIRDRLLGKAGIPADPDSLLVRSARLMRTYNYVRLLGSQVLSSLADAGRVVTMYGLPRTGKALAVLATNVKAFNLSRADAKRMGIGLDWTLNTRGATLGDVGEFADTPTEVFAQKAGSFFSRATGMATWNSTVKFLAASLQQDQILRTIAKGEISERNLAKFAQLGLDKRMLERIGQQAAKHGDDTEGLARARSELWDDKEAALIYESAILKAADTAVLTKGAGDTPLFMSSELGKTIFQFKSFGMAAVNRLLIPAAQGIQRGDLSMMAGLSIMLSLGVLRYVARNVADGRDFDTDPKRLITEAIDGAGLSSYLIDGYDVFAGMTGLPRASRYTDRSWIETAAGPSAGTITDFGRTVEDLRKDGLSKKDIHKIRKLFPGQNIVYLRRLINLMEGETAEALGVPEK